MAIGATYREARDLADTIGRAEPVDRRPSPVPADGADRALRGFHGRVVVQPEAFETRHGVRLEHYLRLAQKRGVRVEYSTGIPFEVA